MSTPEIWERKASLSPPAARGLVCLDADRPHPGGQSKQVSDAVAEAGRSNHVPLDERQRGRSNMPFSFTQ